MSMSITAWCRRLSKQLPGWHVWRSGGGGVPGSAGWYAVPAPDDVEHTGALSLPNRLGPYRTPQELRADCAQRYGFDDHCQSCGVLARDCGHRGPETPVTG